MNELVLISEILQRLEALESLYQKEFDFLVSVDEEPRFRDALGENITRCKRIRHIISDMKPLVAKSAEKPKEAEPVISWRRDV